MTYTLDQLWRHEGRRVLATLIRLLRDFDLAEEALHEAFLAAAKRWPVDGMPANPVAWLVSAGRFRAIDRIRRQDRLGAIAADPALAPLTGAEEEPLPDDPLRLIFACCHPDLAPEAQVALTLHTVCGLRTEEIARAFLLRTPTVAQRIVRAKARIRDLGLPYAVPAPDEMPPRLEAVLRVIYLLFNEGHSAQSGPDLMRPQLVKEAVSLGRQLAGMLPDTEVMGLLALMLLTQSRMAARQGPDGALILLADQDRSLWDQGLIAEGVAMVQRAFATGTVGPYVLQAAIAAQHCVAPSPEATDWEDILGLYTVLARAAPSPVVALNRAVALGMVRGPEAALTVIAPLAAGPLADYAPAHAAMAEMLARLDRRHEAAEASRRALALTRQGPEQRHLQGRIDALLA